MVRAPDRPVLPAVPVPPRRSATCRRCDLSHRHAPRQPRLAEPRARDRRQPRPSPSCARHGVAVSALRVRARDDGRLPAGVAPGARAARRAGRRCAPDRGRRRRARRHREHHAHRHTRVVGHDRAADGCARAGFAVPPPGVQAAGSARARRPRARRRVGGSDLLRGAHRQRAAARRDAPAALPAEQRRGRLGLAAVPAADLRDRLARGPAAGPGGALSCAGGAVLKCAGGAARVGACATPSRRR